ncbi:uroporphyrinogen decarboxylase family protein [Candidatus Latescibacterota bacterium]
MDSPRQRFLDYVRRVPDARPVVSPFLPHGPLVTRTLEHLGLPAAGDHFENEIRLARELAYEPMFMCGGSGLIFPWEEDDSRSDADWSVSVLATPEGEWVRKVSRQAGLFGDESGFPVRSEADHHKLVAVCDQIRDREEVIRAYFRDCRQRIGEEGVIVIGHPHVTWLGYQIGQQSMIFHALDYPETYAASMEAICRASLVLFEFAMEEGVDFMSESGYGMEMISPEQFAAQDLPYTRRLADWTHERGGLMWYHNCGQTRQLIEAGHFDALGADVIETLAPPTRWRQPRPGRLQGLPGSGHLLQGKPEPGPVARGQPRRGGPTDAGDGPGRRGLPPHPLHGRHPFRGDACGELPRLPAHRQGGGGPAGLGGAAHPAPVALPAPVPAEYPTRRLGAN